MCTIDVMLTEDRFCLFVFSLCILPLCGHGIYTVRRIQRLNPALNTQEFIDALNRETEQQRVPNCPESTGMLDRHVERADPKNLELRTF
jgi:hypothetical protein